MTTQPTVNAIEKHRLSGYSAIDLSTTAGAQEMARRLLAGRLRPGPRRLGEGTTRTRPRRGQRPGRHHALDRHPQRRRHRRQLPRDFVNNPLSTEDEYVKALTQDKGQFLADGMMPDGGPQTVYDVEKLAGKITGNVDLSKTYTNAFVIEANKELGYAQ